MGRDCAPPRHLKNSRLRRERLGATRPLGERLYLEGKPKEDKSMLLKQKITEDMYVMDLQALCTWLDWSIVESEFLTMKPTSITPCLK
jgi:hypothetical protein